MMAKLELSKTNYCPAQVDVHIGGVFRDIFEGELVNGTWSGKVLVGKDLLRIERYADRLVDKE